MLKRHLCFVMFFIISCSSHAQTVKGDKTTYISDPIEPVNRLVWDFNYYVLDNYIYRPVTESYVEWIPKLGRQGLSNFVSNLDEPSTIVNNLLQLEFGHATDAFFRFAFNTTFGIFGLIDVAKIGGVERRRESFSNVLGNWSVPQGPYLMLPVVGPRTTRVLVGTIVDNLYFPASYFELWQTGVVWGISGLEARASLLGQEVLIDQSLDPYTFVKESYYQYQEFNANHGSNDEFFKLKQQNSEKQTQEDLSGFLDEID